jgi:hypothetical protein
MPASEASVTVAPDKTRFRTTAVARPDPLVRNCRLSLSKASGLGRAASIDTVRVTEGFRSGHELGTCRERPHQAV